jgi:hypothetical protein
VPVAVRELVIAGFEIAAGLIVRLKVAEPVPLAFVALTVTPEVPEAEGVPEIRPVAVLTPRPAGKPVAS